MTSRADWEIRTKNFYEYVDELYPSATALLVNWTKKHDVPQHEKYPGYPADIRYIFYFFEKIGIIASAEPRLFSKSDDGKLIYDWYVKDMSWEDNSSILTNAYEIYDKVDAEYEVLDAALEYFDNKLSVKKRM